MFENVTWKLGNLVQGLEIAYRNGNTNTIDQDSKIWNWTDLWFESFGTGEGKCFTLDAKKLQNNEPLQRIEVVHKSDLAEFHIHGRKLLLTEFDFVQSVKLHEKRSVFIEIEFRKGIKIKIVKCKRVYHCCP